MPMHRLPLLLCLPLMACAPTVEPEFPSPADRAWLARALVCGDSDFAGADVALQRARLVAVAGVRCESGETYPLVCSMAPPLALGDFQVAWWRIERHEGGVLGIVIPAPPERVAPLVADGAGRVVAAPDIGDSEVACARGASTAAP